MKTHTGFTLIEVLIAMIILAIGLLGLAALQTTNIRNNLAAYNHGQATQLLYDISDRMRANDKTVASSYVIANSNNLSSSTPNAACSTACSTAVPTACSACTPTVLAQNDLIEWNRAIASANLPMGRGTVASTATAGIYTLSITWDDDRNGAVDSNDPTFTTGLQLQQ
jgi:type IV pilus assembly protein PilV